MMHSESWHRGQVELPPSLRARLIEHLGFVARVAQEMAIDAQGMPDEVLVSRIWRLRNLLITILLDAVN